MNPYQYENFLAGMRTEPGRFIGPREELEQVLLRVSDERPAAVLLVGPWGVGKSFLLNLLADNSSVIESFRHILGPAFAEAPDRMLFVLTVVEDYRSLGDGAAHLFSRLWQNLIQRLADAHAGADHGRRFASQAAAYLCRHAQPERADPDGLLASALGLATPPPAVGAEDLVVDAGQGLAQNDAAGEALLALSEQLEGAGLRLVFLVDDFERVAPAISYSDYDRLWRLIHHTSMVITSSKPLSRLAPSTKLSSPFFSLLDQVNRTRGVVNMFFLTQAEATRLVIAPPSWRPETASFRFSEQDAAYIIELVGLHHELIRLACEYLYSWHLRYGVAGAAHVIPPAARPGVRVMLRSALSPQLIVLWQRLDPEERSALAQAAEHEDEADQERLLSRPAFARLIEMNYLIYREGRIRIFAAIFADYIREALSLAPGALGALPIEALELTALERDLLLLLADAQGRAVSRAELLGRLYPDEQTGADHGGRLDVLVSRLRAKLRREGTYDIETMRGRGYRLAPRAEA